jgi:putative FmdB family regulatory protein
MPTYEYRCPKGHEFELFQRMSDEPRTACPECGDIAERLLSGGAGLIFKGEGFYITDYRSDEYKKAASSDKEAASDKGAASDKVATSDKGASGSSSDSGGLSSGGGSSDGGSSKSKGASSDQSRASGGSKPSGDGKSSSSDA